jgi:hypothetical protein
MNGFPESTRYGKRIPKRKFYEHLDFTPRLTQVFTEQIDCVIWQNKLAPSTSNFAAGEVVSEIQVLTIRLNEKTLDRQVLPFLNKGIPYHILFVLVCGGEAQSWIEAHGTFSGTDWLPIDSFEIKPEGLNLDAVYDNMVRWVAGGRLGGGDLGEAVAHDNKRQRLERDIAALEKKVANERQFNKQVELNRELKRLRKELECLG